MKNQWARSVFIGLSVVFSACSALVGGYDRIEARDGGPDAIDDTGTTDVADIGDAELIDAPLADAPDSSTTPSTPNARFPWNGFTTPTITPRFMWSMDDGAYRIQLTRECTVSGFQMCSFSDIEVEKTGMMSSSMPTSFVPENDLAVSAMAPVGSRYYWRVRACESVGASPTDDVECSAWSEIRYLDVGRDDHDFTGDGVGDLAVGAPLGDSMDALNGGRVHIYIDGLDQPPASFGNPEGIPDGRFGSALTYGDTNADGYADLIAAAVLQTADTQTLSGAVFVALGNSSGDYSPVILHDPNPQMGGVFGTSVATGDLDGDGFADVLVGTHRREDDHDKQGLIYIYWGAREGINMTPTRLPHPEMRAGSRFGAKISAGGDLDGNGQVDLVVSAVSEAEMAGAAYVFGFDGRNASLIRRLAGLRAGDSFGSSLAMGDMSGDGFSELMVGVGTPSEIQVFYGSSSGIGVTATETIVRLGMEENGFGRALCNVGDLDGDGFSDLAIGAPQQRVRVDRVGQVHLFLGRPDFPGVPLTIDGPDELSGILFGTSISRLRNVHGLRGFVVGAPDQDIDMDETTREGAAYAFEGISLVRTTTVVDPDGNVGDDFGRAMVR